MKKFLYVLVFTLFANNIVFGQQCGTTIQSIDEMDLIMPGYKIGVQKALGNADKKDLDAREFTDLVDFGGAVQFNHYSYCSACNL